MNVNWNCLRNDVEINQIIKSVGKIKLNKQ